MDPNNPLADREKALENQWIREKEIQKAKERAASKAQASKDSTVQGQGQNSGGSGGQEHK